MNITEIEASWRKAQRKDSTAVVWCYDNVQKLIDEIDRLEHELEKASVARMSMLLSPDEKPGEAEIVLPEPVTKHLGTDEYREWNFPDGSYISESVFVAGKFHVNPNDGIYHNTPHAAARALAALGKGPGAAINSNQGSNKQ